LSKDKEIAALIGLLDDPDPEIFNHIRDKLLFHGKSAIVSLEHAWGGSLNAILQERIENVIHQIQLDEIQRELIFWSDFGSSDLLKGALLIAKYQYPDLNEDSITEDFDKMVREIRPKMIDNLLPIEKVKILNEFFYDIYGFRGNTTNYQSPQNSYLNNVMESKKGNPLSLGIIYSVIAHHLSIPLYGVNLPHHFVLAYMEEGTDILTSQEEKKSNVLFYINVFNFGNVFTDKEMNVFIKKLDVKPSSSFFMPCSNIDIIVRIVHNLMHSYEKLGFSEKINELKMLKKCLTDK